jgi:heme oxygenase (mycobilin-producing)
MNRVRVLLFHEAPSPAGITDAYHAVSADLAGTPGLLGNELLTAIDDPTWFLVMSEWTDLDAFTTWEQGAAHKGTTAPLRQYRDTRMTRPFGIFKVDAEY